MRVKELVAFIKERERVRLAKEVGKPRPWTADPILDKYRFCNVHREDDYVTRWLRANWYRHLADSQDLWFAAVVARLFNQPDALYDIMPYVLPWKPEKVRAILHRRKAAGKKNFNAAYIVSTNGIAMDKVDYIVQRVLTPLWNARKQLRPYKTQHLSEFHAALMRFDGMGSFIAAQVVADLKHEVLCDLSTAPDLNTFAASGPGSRRGMSRLLYAEPGWSIPEGQWHDHLTKLRAEVNKLLKSSGIWLDAQDLQNCLCEFDKYERARFGQGEPKQIYKERSQC